MNYSIDDQFDRLFAEIISRSSGLPHFLEAVFGFLRRKTDLYYTLTNEQQKVGFPIGYAENLIKSTFLKHKSIFEADLTTLVPEKCLEVKKEMEKEVIKLEKTIPVLNTTKKNTKDTVTPETYVQDSECYNGAVRDNYSWSQTIDEIDIRINMPAFVTTSKDIKIHVEKKYLNVSVKSKESQSFISVLDGNLSWDIRKNELIWSFDPKECKVIIALEKVQERWWDSFFVGESTIDTRAIDCSRPMSDLDEEAQAKIHKLMYDNKQKQLGLPTSDEQRVNDVLRSAWNVDTSPFKGHEFNPSKIDIVGNTSTM